MDVHIEPRQLAGAVTPPPSKSEAHRLLIAAALGTGQSRVRNVAFSKDIEATIRCITALGGRVAQDGEDELVVDGIGRNGESGEGEGAEAGEGARDDASPLPTFDCGESGSTLRFFIPIALAVAHGGVFSGRGRLMSRPLSPYFDLFEEHGISYTQDGDTLTVSGTLTPGTYRLPGNVSSQFFTGLLFALPLLDGPSTLISTTPVESADYIAMTLDALAQAGVNIAHVGEQFFITPGTYAPIDSSVEADWSQAGFWYAARHLGCDVDICGLNPASAQGDKRIAAFATELAQEGDVTIDISQSPDLLPPLAVMAAVRRGTTTFANAARLRIKESDRLASTCAMLCALGGQAQEAPDTLTVTGATHLNGGTVDGANDHRIVMAAAIAACACEKPVIITGAEAITKSYPDFFTEYERLGGSVHVL